MMLRFVLTVFILVTVVRCQLERNDVQDLIKQLFPDKHSINSTTSTATTTESSSPVPEVINKTEEVCKDGHACIPYYLCKDNTIITNGESVVDIRRVGEDSASGCENYFEVCCALNSTATLRKRDPSPNICGYRNVNGVGFRITGDENNESQYGEFPWMVAIIKVEKNESNSYNVYLCGGSLIHLSVVITGAHCVVSKPVESLKVRAGEWDTQTKAELYEYQDRDVKNIIIHDDYHSGALFNDIALIFVSKPFVTEETIKPVCLPPPNQNFDLESCYATGWGKDTFGRGGSYQVILKKIKLPIVPHKICQDELRKTRLGKFFILDESFICAGGETGKDTCTGDGGSPLVCPIPGTESRYYQAGIVAWGIGCGETIPAAYSNVAYLRPWIDKQLLAANISSSSFTP